MALMGDGRPESEAIAWGVQRHIRQKVLEAVPDQEAEAVTVGSLAMRLAIAHDRIRPILRQLQNAGEIFSTNGRGTVRYHRDKEANTMTDHQEDLRTRILNRLPRNIAGAQGLTALEVASEINTRPNTVSTELKAMVDDQVAQRCGAGKRGDPYLYFEATAYCQPHEIPGRPDLGPEAENEAPERAETADLPSADTAGPPDPVAPGQALEEELPICGDPMHRHTGPCELYAQDQVHRGIAEGVEWPRPTPETQEAATERLEKVARQLAEDLGLEVVIRRPGEGDRPVSTEQAAYEIVVENLGRRCAELRRELGILEAALELARRIRCEERDLAIATIEEQVLEEAAQ